MKTLSLAFGLLLASTAIVSAHQSFYTADQVIHNSPEWTGERFADGRPKVPDTILDRMKNVTLEEAWSILRNAGYDNQYEDGWATELFAGKIMVGRALTSSWIPGRLDLQKVIEADGIAEKRKGAPNAWPVDMLQPRDVYVSDHFGLKKDGPSIGDNVANAIYARSGIPTHASRQLSNGNWTSKLGQSEDIEHTLAALAGSVYGDVALILAKQST